MNSNERTIIVEAMIENTPIMHKNWILLKDTARITYPDKLSVT